MFRFIAALFILATLGVCDVARSDAPKGGLLGDMPSPMKEGQKDKWQQFMDSEEGRAIQFYGDKARRGEMTMEEAIKAYRDKYHGGQPPNYNAIIEGAK